VGRYAEGVILNGAARLFFVEKNGLYRGEGVLGKVVKRMVLCGGF